MLKNILFLIFLFVTTISATVPIEPESKKDTVLSYRISDIIITANKILTPSLEVASSISVITKKDIEEKHSTYLSDILRSEVGLSLAQQGGAGKISRVFLRGSNPHHTLFLIDGVEVNNPSSINNAYDLSSFQTDNIEKIEILRGPQSTLYGSDAMAGVISIFTTKGEGKPKFQLEGEGGSYNTYKGNAGLNGSLNILSYSLNFSRLRSDGISSASSEYGNTEKDFNDLSSVNARAGLDLFKNFNLDLLYSFSKSKAGLDQNEKLGDDPNFEYKQEETSLRSAANVKLFNSLWEQTLAISFMRIINKTTDDIDIMHPDLASVNYFNGNRLKFDWQNILNLSSNNKLLLGFDTEKEQGYSSYWSKSMWGESLSGFPNSSSTTTGFYVQGQNKIYNALFSNAGVRYDNNNRFGSQVTYRLAEAYFLHATSTKFKGSFGTGFKAPSLYYLLEPLYGNKDLKPEKSKGWDFGAEQYLLDKKLSFGVTYFQNRFNNLIGYDANYKTVNIDKAETKGWEIFLNINPFENLTVAGNYTYSSNKDLSLNNDNSGKDLIRRPKNKGAITINYSLYGAAINLETIFTGKREDKEFLPDYTSRRVDLKKYTLVNIAASYQITKYLNLFGRLENLLHEKYEEVLFYGTPGRSFYAGIRLSY